MTPLLAQTVEWVRSQLPAPGHRALTDQDKADAALAARMLRTEDGMRLLEILARATVYRPPTDPRFAGEAARDFAMRRAGENGVFGVLVHLLDTHDHLTRKDHAPENPAAPDLQPVFGWRDPAPGLARWGDPAGGDDAGGGGGIAFDPGGTIAVR